MGMGECGPGQCALDKRVAKVKVGKTAKGR
jgi:hypothetical protein